jgi:hypothetical protein
VRVVSEIGAFPPSEPLHTWSVKPASGIDEVRVTTATELNKYFEMINRRLPTRMSASIEWLRKPSSFSARLIAALLLILGGFFSFLPILGVWMLPLGLMLIAQDLPFLQKPLVKTFEWVEAKWRWLKVKLEKRSLALPMDDSRSLKEPR